jgi:Fe-S cluster assembly ATP-binding protein
MADLEVKDLHINVDDKEIIKGVSLRINKGEIHAIMGPNGSGKSTICNTIMGSPRYTVTAGDIFFQGESILELSADRRARRGLFLAFQNPLAVPGVTVSNFLRSALTNRRKGDVAPVIKPANLNVEGDKPFYENKENKKTTGLGSDGKNIDRTKRETLISPREFRGILKEKMNLLQVDEKFTKRYLNEGFSGGEKKRNEILQMAVLNPVIAMLDEPDSGLDIDAIRVVGEAVARAKGPETGILIITHQHRILNYIQPDFVHVMMQGKIVKEGGPELAAAIEERGYGWIREELGLPVGFEQDVEEVQA